MMSYNSTKVGMNWQLDEGVIAQRYERNVKDHLLQSASYAYKDLYDFLNIKFN